MSLPTLDIVIVNWNTGLQLWQCILSILDARRDGFHLDKIVVVDNASADDSLAPLQSLHYPVRILRNSANRGFAAACNQGAEGSSADYLLFLNPDVRLQPDSLDCPLRLLERSPQVGICGIQLVDDSGQVSRSCARVPTPRQMLITMLGLNQLAPHWLHGQPMLEWDHAQNQAVDQVIGAFFLIRRPLFTAMQGFDERFFVYFEEADLAKRVKEAGRQSYYLADARAYHKGGGATEQVKAQRHFYYLRSRSLFAFKHYARITALFLLFLALTIEPIIRILFVALGRRSMSVQDILAAYWMLLRSFLTGGD